MKTYWIHYINCEREYCCGESFGDSVEEARQEFLNKIDETIDIIEIEDVSTGEMIREPV